MEPEILVKKYQIKIFFSPYICSIFMLQKINRHILYDVWSYYLCALNKSFISIFKNVIFSDSGDFCWFLGEFPPDFCCFFCYIITGCNTWRDLGNLDPISAKSWFDTPTRKKTKQLKHLYWPGKVRWPRPLPSNRQSATPWTGLGELSLVGTGLGQLSLVGTGLVSFHWLVQA